jgi:3-keto-disaccharide hydrolase
MFARVLAVALALVVVGSGRGEDADRWIDLFNGKDLSGWEIDGPTEFKDKADGNKAKPLWTVQDGLIRTTGAAFGFLRYDRVFDDFILHVEYRLVKERGANSGIGIRTKKYETKDPTASRPSFYSYEVQLLDDADAKPGKGSTGSLYRYVAPAKVANKPAPEWNAVEIECKGPKIRVNFNGTDTLVFDQSTDEKLKSKPLSGYVCLQSHSKQAEFRNVRIKPLK